jgi:hypothetical protein
LLDNAMHTSALGQHRNRFLYPMTSLVILRVHSCFNDLLGSVFVFNETSVTSAIGTSEVLLEARMDTLTILHHHMLALRALYDYVVS